MNKSHPYKSIAVSLSLAAALVGCAAETPEVEPGLGSVTEALSARKAFGKTKPQRPQAKHRLVVKFTDDLRIRATPNGGVRSDATSIAAQSSAAAVSQVAQPFGMRFSQLIQLPEQRLEALRTRAAQASNEAQPDLAGILVAEVSEADMQAAADALHASPLTEFVYFQELTPPPPQACVDIAPTTPSYVSLQGYRGPNPGVNMTAAWALGPARGAGIKIADCEYGYHVAHEDLCGVIMEPGQTPHPAIAEEGWDHHGTAVLGELTGRDNAYGCTGLAPDAQAYFFPEWTVEEGFRRATAITNAIATVDPGDVVLLEMQTSIAGPDLYGPAELDPAVWLAVKSGTDAGVIVVAAAGNGTQNLDSSVYDEYRSRGDSGAIIVGAGSANTAHQPLWFSSYGSRVNVQGWGESVVTTGYGTLAQLGGDVNQSYASSFGGTSSASPIVAASVAAVQSYAVSSLGRRLTPLQMRNLLIETGTPQGAGVHIGPLPNVAAAIQALSTDTGTTYPAENATRGGGTVLETTNAGFLGTAYVNFPANGGTLTFSNVPGNGGGAHNLSIRYANGGTTGRTGNIIVNGVSSTITFPPTGGWAVWQSITRSVTLVNSATNTIQLTSTGADLGNVDQITLSRAVTADTYQAENYPITGTGTVVETIHAGYLGTGYVNLGLNAGTLTFTGVDGNGGGSKTLALRYALGGAASRAGNIVVNGVSTPLTLAPTGAWTTWSTLNVAITLNNNNTNTIGFATTGNDFGNVDQITVP